MLSVQLMRRREALTPQPPVLPVPLSFGSLEPFGTVALPMRHATPDDLVPIEALLRDLRSVSGLVERTPGVFYRRSRAFLHFHADPSGLFADVRLDGEDFERIPVNSPGEQAALLGQVRVAVGEDARPAETALSGRRRSGRHPS